MLWPKAETLPKNGWKSELWKTSAAKIAADLNLRQPFNYGQTPQSATIIFLEKIRPTVALSAVCCLPSTSGDKPSARFGEVVRAKVRDSLYSNREGETQNDAPLPGNVVLHRTTPTTAPFQASCSKKVWN